MSSPATVYIVSGLTEKGRVERVLGALQSVCGRVRHIEPHRNGTINWPTLRSGDVLILHFGGLKHSAAENGRRHASAYGAPCLCIRSLNLDTIRAFVTRSTC